MRLGLMSAERGRLWVFKNFNLKLCSRAVVTGYLLLLFPLSGCDDVIIDTYLASDFGIQVSNTTTCGTFESYNACCGRVLQDILNELETPPNLYYAKAVFINEHGDECFDPSTINCRPNISKSNGESLPVSSQNVIALTSPDFDSEEWRNYCEFDGGYISNSMTIPGVLYTCTCK